MLLRPRREEPRTNGSSVRVGIIGAGSALWAYLQLLDRLTPRRLATTGPICARRHETWDRIRSRRPDAEIVATPEEVVRSEVDVIAVLTSAASHGELARLALDRGKHVLIEKPLAGSVEEATELAARARDRGLHLVAAPFIHLSPTFRLLWSEVAAGAIGEVHSGRGLYGVPSPDWNTWMVEVGPLADLGIYNLKSFTSLLGPIVEVMAVETTARPSDSPKAVPDVIHVIARHERGALSSVVASWEIQAYRRPGLELYGTEGTANLLGDDWDPGGYRIFRAAEGAWREVASPDPTWLWTDGLRELVSAIHEGRPPLGSIDQDIHLVEVLAAARRSAAARAPVAVGSRFEPMDLGLELRPAHLHDHTRSPDEQR